MELTIRETNGQRYLEGHADHPLLKTANDTAIIIEQCLEHRINRLLLYANNLPDHFFDLSSGEAGTILQKLQNYRIKIAVILPPNTRHLSQPAQALFAEENRGDAFHLCADRSTGETWLLQH